MRVLSIGQYLKLVAFDNWFTKYTDVSTTRVLNNVRSAPLLNRIKDEAGFD